MRGKIAVPTRRECMVRRVGAKRTRGPSHVKPHHFIFTLAFLCPSLMIDLLHVNHSSQHSCRPTATTTPIITGFPTSLI
ncbi:hypothetical protein AAZX31_13G232700 [Glycine max]|uniref:Uncharacterized protein n=1 Tax=Glycine max TaxID=3847 RepID=K7M1T3_SOYBN|nr:hypothetical protein GYH30_037312 [Glycine max]KRH21642.1 hypothetical protein GLYMA_13G250600v4 [Glycine max]